MQRPDKVKDSPISIALSDAHRELGSYMRRARERANFTLAEVAKETGISINSLRRHECGSRMLRADAVQLVAWTLGLTASDLFPWEPRYSREGNGLRPFDEIKAARRKEA